MLLLPPPPTLFSSPSSLSSSSSSSSYIFLRHRHHNNRHLLLSTTTSSPLSSLENRHYDFSPLLQFLSSSTAQSQSQTPTSLHPTELRLAESYRAVPAPLWHSLLKSLSSSPSTLNSATALVSWLQRHNLCFSYELLYSILIHALGRSQKLYEAFLLSHQSPSPSPLTFNALISACARNDDPEKALHVLSRMRRLGLHPDLPNYSLIVQCLLRTSRPVDPSLLHNLCQDLSDDHLEPDCPLLNDLSVAFAKAGDPSRSLHFVSVLQSHGLSPKSSTFVAVISSLANLGRTSEAEVVFEEMREGGLTPRTRAFNALLKGYVKTGALKAAESLVSAMEGMGVAPDEHTYSLLMDAYSNAGRWESARILLKEMEDSNVRPNSYVFSRILASYRDKGDWQKSFLVLKEMRSNGVRPDRHFYNVMIDTFGRYKCLEHAVETFQRMVSDGIQPDVVTWNTLIDCHCKAGQHERAWEMFEEMRESGCLPCATTYNIMINSLGEERKFDEVKSLLGKMRSEGLLPNAVSYTTLVDIYGQSGSYHPIPMVFSQAKGSCVWDPEGHKYLDFLSAYSAVNQGHCHPKIIKALTEQAERLTLSSRAFYNDTFPILAERLTSLFGYKMMLPMNTGAEGVETALKLARKWGYEKKKIPKDEAIIVSCYGCFHGRTLAVISMSCDNDATCGFGPLLPGHLKVDFGDADAIEKIFIAHGDRIAGFLFEPIQGEAGVILLPDGYLMSVRNLCSKYNILMTADEIQTGIARTGKMLACDWENIRPDVVILGKALGAGVIPVSAVLADNYEARTQIRDTDTIRYGHTTTPFLKKVGYDTPGIC